MIVLKYLLQYYKNNENKKKGLRHDYFTILTAITEKILRVVISSINEAAQNFDLLLIM